MENSLEKRIEVAQRFDREKGDAKSTLKEFLGIYDCDVINTNGPPSETPQIDSTVTATSFLEQSTSSDELKIKEEENISEEEQSSSVISYQSFGPINFAVVSACPESDFLESQQNSSDTSAVLLENTASERTIQLDIDCLPQQLHEGNHGESSQAKQINCHKTLDSNLCDMCDRQFSSSSALSAHKRIHTMNRPFKCDICDKKFAYFHGLHNHKRVHTGEKPFQCNVCSKKFTFSSTLSIHKGTHDPAKQPYKCGMCHKKFAHGDHLLSHAKAHLLEIPVQCDVCGKKFFFSSDLSAHKRTHSAAKPYQCDVCDKKLANPRNLSIHKRLHTGEKPFKCDVCDKKYSSASILSTHKKYCKKSPSLQTQETASTHARGKNFKCIECNQEFDLSEHLIAHVKVHLAMSLKCSACDV